MKTISKYVVYFRVSTKRQGDSGLGLEAQKSYISMFLNDTDIVATFTDIKSGKNAKNRPELQKALQYCKANNCGLAVAKIDRLSRNTEQALQIYNDLSGFLFSADIPMQKFSTMEKFQLTLLLAFAERERMLISQRTKQALQNSTKLKGFNNLAIKSAIQNSDKIKNSEIGNYQKDSAKNNLNSLRAIDKVKALLAENMTFYSIAKVLNESTNANGKMIYETPKGAKKWHYATVKNLVQKN